MRNRVKTIGIMVCFISICFLSGCGGSGGGSSDPDDGGGGAIDPFEIEPSSIQTFEPVVGDICREDGKPVIRMFSTTGCSHCQWVADTYDAVVKMYVEEGLIVAYHWELDTGDDMLTSVVEGGVPDAEMAVYNEFNPENLVPAFIFGCRYVRIGTGHEGGGGLEAEAAEFMAVIEALLDE